MWATWTRSGHVFPLPLGEGSGEGRPRGERLSSQRAPTNDRACLDRWAAAVNDDESNADSNDDDNDDDDD